VLPAKRKEAKEKAYLLGLLKFRFTPGCILEVDRECGNGSVDAIDLPDLNLHLPIRRSKTTIH
jgi:hypothetical protein